MRRCVASAEAGVRQSFELDPADAFGEYRAELLQTYPRHAFPDTVEQLRRLLRGCSPSRPCPPG